MYPILINIPSPVKDIHCGWHYSIFTTTDNQFYCCGANSSGELAAASDISENILLPILMKLPIIPDVSPSDITWRVYATSFGSNTFLMARICLNKRHQWMQQKLQQFATGQCTISDVTFNF